MKTQFLSYGGGLITGVLLVMLFSASSVREKDDPELNSERKVAQVATFHLVPLKEFLKNVARYKKMHADVVTANMPRNKKPSRMFIYSIPVLEAFFTEIKAHAYTAELNPDELALRFYYAVYPKDMNKVAGHDYTSLHTLYMSPNYWDHSKRKYVDIDIAALADSAKNLGKEYSEQKHRLIPQFYLENVDSVGRDRDAKVLLLDATAVPFPGSTPSISGSVEPYEFEVINQGQLCPPNCPRNSMLEYADRKYSSGL